MLHDCQWVFGRTLLMYGNMVPTMFVACSLQCTYCGGQRQWALLACVADCQDAWRDWTMRHPPQRRPPTLCLVVWSRRCRTDVALAVAMTSSSDLETSAQYGRRNSTDWESSAWLVRSVGGSRLRASDAVEADDVELRPQVLRRVADFPRRPTTTMSQGRWVSSATETARDSRTNPCLDRPTTSRT